VCLSLYVYVSKCVCVSLCVCLTMYVSLSDWIDPEELIGKLLIFITLKFN